MQVLAMALGVDWIMCYFYIMDGNSRHQVIKRLQAGLPRGAPFDLATLSQFGVSPQLAAHYADGGWLVRLAHGVYAFPNDEFGVYGALKFLQQRVPGLHVGGKSALALQGVRHNLGSREALVLWGDGRFALPAWFTSRFPARYVHARLFDWPDASVTAAVYNIAVRGIDGYGGRLSAFLPLLRHKLWIQPAAGFRTVDVEPQSRNFELTYLSTRLTGRLSRNWSLLGGFTYSYGDRVDSTIIDFGFRYKW